MRNLKLPSKKEINFVFASFSKKEQIVFFGFLLVLLVSTVLILQNINQLFMVQVPLQGGSISTGVVGTPRFINPVLASSEADLDLVSLVYSGLMRKGSDGNLIPDLAEKYEVSADGLIYTFTLKDDLYFHDGKAISADDVVFTINEVKNSIVKIPFNVNWESISILKIDEKTIQFTLRQPYVEFLENTTIGIMPMHLWNDTPLELNEKNTNPVGSGPYMINSISKKSSGVIDYYKLVSFEKFILGEPYIKNINLHFYPNEDTLIKALTDGEIEGVSYINPLQAKNLAEKGYKIESAVLPRVFGLFFNQNINHIFTDKTVVAAIDQVIDKEKIVREVLLGYGTTIDGPIPPNIIGDFRPERENSVSRQNLLEKVQDDLSKSGWRAGEDGFLQKITTENKRKVTTKLAFSISTGNAEELIKTAELIKEDLATIGIKVEVKTFETGNLNQNVIRPRQYDTLLFGKIVNHESDLYAFWHSSQRKDPGLNVSMYTNTKVDKILTDAFILTDEQSRLQKYLEFSEEIKKDIPAVFLYSPDFLYTVSKNLKGFEMDNIISPADRYLNVYSWYIQTEKVWKIFTPIDRRS